MEKNFEDICFEFQQQIVNIFNKEQNIPFLMKYYLVKEIWDDIQENKLRMDMRVRENHPPDSEIITTKNQNITEENLTN